MIRLAYEVGNKAKITFSSERTLELNCPINNYIFVGENLVSFHYVINIYIFQSNVFLLIFISCFC